jgi:hypothetical protein
LVGLSAASASGRLRWLSLMPVGTKNGHSTEAPILLGDELEILVQRLAHRHHGVLARVVDAHVGGFSRPAIDAVLTMWPSYEGFLAAASSIIGVKTRNAVGDTHDVDAEHPCPVGGRVSPRSGRRRRRRRC